MACATCHKVYVYSEDDVLDSDARPHVCKTCGLSFSLKIQLKRHTLLHSNGSSYVCVNCSKYHNEDVDKAYNLRLPTTSDYVCLVCNESFKTKRLLIKHTNKEHSMRVNYECHVCFETYDSASDLKKHSVVHHSKVVHKRKKKKFEADDLDYYDPSPVQEKKESNKSFPQRKLICTTCGKGFAYEGSYEKHIKKCGEESKSSPKVSSKKVKIDIPDFDKIDKKYECNVCGQGFDRKKALDGHELTHLLNKDNSSNDGFSDDDSEEFIVPFKKRQSSKKLTIKQSFTCDSCNFVCFSKATLIKHKLNHKSSLNDTEMERDSLKCSDCHEMFFSADELQEHRLVPCTKEKGKKVKYKSSELKIKKEMHQCNFCEKEFLTSKYLKQHLLLHKVDNSTESPSPEKVARRLSDDIIEYSDDDDLSLVKVIKHRSKKFVCNLCGKRFAGETCLRKHIERHSSRDTSKPRTPREEKGKRSKNPKLPQTFICDFCQEEFTGKRGAYIKHVHSHTPEVCGICDERFVDRQGLREHCKIHVGTEEGRMFMECSQKALDAKNGVAPPEPKVEYIYLVLP